jgi:3-hydroxyisobutyrate dehydrogenase
MKNIGFIGLGNMGLEMIKNLNNSDYNLLGYDINKNIYSSLNIKNISTTDNIIEIFKTCEVILTMLPDGAAVKSVFSENMIHASEKSIIVDCSTIDIETTNYIHNSAKKLNLLSLDAPVSGGVSGAKAASLTFMVGGDENTYNLILPIFKLMGNKAIYCGKEGSGQAVKICNNLILAISMIGVGEAINLANNLNLDLQKFFDVTSTSSASCWAINNYFPVSGIGPISPADNNFAAGFSIDLMTKDLSLAINASKTGSDFLVFGKQALDKYKKMSKIGKGKNDFSAIVNNI